jgi:hypothetical protein
MWGQALPGLPSLLFDLVPRSAEEQEIGSCFLQKAHCRTIKVASSFPYANKCMTGAANPPPTAKPGTTVVITLQYISL